MKIRSLATVAAFLLAPLSWSRPLEAAESLTVAKDSVQTFYKDFKRLTEKPQFVASPLIAILCKLPTKEILEKQRATTGPHSDLWVHIYANAPAAEAITRKATEFPVGAVIVKEKLGRDNAIADIGGMIKRAPGYDAANGDWEFFFFARGGDFASGKLSNCVDCHNGARRDHVFKAWNLGGH